MDWGRHSRIAKIVGMENTLPRRLCEQRFPTAEYIFIEGPPGRERWRGGKGVSV